MEMKTDLQEKTKDYGVQIESFNLLDFKMTKLDPIWSQAGKANQKVHEKKSEKDDETVAENTAPYPAMPVVEEPQKLTGYMVDGKLVYLPFDASKIVKA